MEARQEDKLPLDARILSKAVIELNVSRRNVGLYPAGHEKVLGSIEKAFGLLQRLFELRNDITLEISGETLIIDGHVLDRQNPAFREYANSLNGRGIASITLSSGMKMEEIITLNDILTMKEAPIGEGFVTLARQKGIAGLLLSPVDHSGAKVIEGEALPSGDHGGKTWEEYVNGLLNGGLASDETVHILSSATPGEIAELLNGRIKKSGEDDNCDAIISAYLKSTDDQSLRTESVTSLFSMISSLTPDLKKRYLKESLTRISVDLSKAENVLRSMHKDDFQQFMEMIGNHSSLIPDALRNVLYKLAPAGDNSSFRFDVLNPHVTVVDDIEMGKSVACLFNEDLLETFLNPKYRRDLRTQLDAPSAISTKELTALRDECNDPEIDRVVSEVVIEVLESDVVTQREYLEALTSLTELATSFIGTGRFEETLEIYNTLYSHSLSSRFKYEASSAIQYYFQQKAFMARFVEAARTWGRKDRQGVFRLARALKAHAISPLMEAVKEEQVAGIRRFLLTVLANIGSDVIPEAIRGLDDKEWYVRRNMLYLIRKCMDEKYLDQVRKLGRDPDPRIAMEALEALLQFGTKDAVPLLKIHLHSDDIEHRNRAIKIAGKYKVKEAVTQLVEILGKKDVLGATVSHKFPVVKALGAIGDARALKPLENILRSRALLNRSALNDLKLEIYRSLANYSDNAARELVETGLDSRNEEIKSVCKDIMLSFRSRKKVDPNA